ncbi:ORF6N domain-containing protein [Acinetobacter baumannii]|uniref:ORF6N domain-containing protein n=1 Tax=Acinetobacter baumannii TaxID=470 RepID=UPI000F679A78|nr:ORF6N domain-containing protein [Acinetobacter baumannii]MCT9396938.1 ORF6N domain-containing protein [Acinetobacter baumannii]RSE48889.1 ORF6N domain-containing protein [Acinetobacter baumannii]
MVSLTQINNTQVSVINFKSIPVVTTEMLAGFYGTESVRIRQNHNENKQRFIEGKHFFKIVGQELKDFVSSLKLLANSPTISNKVRSLILWTERGAARHAKMLDTDQAWEVFEQLEDCYFVRKEILAKTHKSERTPLHDAHALLVAKTKRLNSSDAWKIINQRFGTNHIDEIPYDMIPVAVEYVHHLIAMYSGAEKKGQGSLFDKDAYELVRKLTEAVIIENDEIVPVLLAVKMLDMKKFAYYSHLVVKANEAARDIARLLDFRNLQNEPLIDADCSVIAMSNGQRFLARPNWFNCPA